MMECEPRELASRLQDAGFNLSKEELDLILPGYCYLKAMVMRLHGPRPREAESALVFVLPQEQIG